MAIQLKGEIGRCGYECENDGQAIQELLSKVSSLVWEPPILKILQLHCLKVDFAQQSKRQNLVVRTIFFYLNSINKNLLEDSDQDLKKYLKTS